MKSETKNQIIQTLMHEIGNIYTELPYGCVMMIVESELDDLLEKIEDRAKAEQAKAEKYGWNKR